jgi:hypothetical protein
MNDHIPDATKMINDSPTMRDLFALVALPVACKTYESFSFDVNAIAQASYQLADAMLKAREAK